MIMETLASGRGEPLALSEIAAACELNLSTCANLLKTLVARGYAEQLGTRQGYVLGPMAHVLSQRSPYRPDVARVAEPLLAELAAELREGLVLSRLHEGRLYMLCHNQGDDVLQVRADLMLAENVFKTANGRLLLAYAPPEEVERLLRLQAWPLAHWPEMKTREQLAATLAAIRRQGYYEDQCAQNLARLSFPVTEHGRVIAALGLFAPQFRFAAAQREAALAGLRRVAQAISEKLEAGSGTVSGRPRQEK
jgi:DNA-binding IclR family transcriptional regulator